MAVNESKARLDSPQWANWRNSSPSAIGTMETARARQRVTQLPRLDHHLASSLVSGENGSRILVATIDLGSSEGSILETMLFRLPEEMVDVTLDNLTDPSADLRTPSQPELQSYIDIRNDSAPAAIRQHNRTVRVVSMLLGTPRSPQEPQP